MKLRRSFATAAVAFAGMGSLLAPLPMAQAATVDVNGNQCSITITWEDMTELRNGALNSDPEGLARLKAAVPGIDAELDLLAVEVKNQARTTGELSIYAFSQEEYSAWSKYLFVGTQAGYSVSELQVMLESVAIPEVMAYVINSSDITSLVGSHVINRADAQDVMGEIEFVRSDMGFYPDQGIYFGTTVSAKANEVIKPSMASLDLTMDGLTQPFDDCAAGRSTEDGKPVENETPTNTGGGSSFGSS